MKTKIHLGKTLQGNAAGRNMHSQSLRLPWHWGAFCSSMYEQMGKKGYYGAL